MVKIWGVNWKTSLSGIVTTIAGFFATNPELFDHFPVEWKDTLIFINKVLLILGGASFSVSVKDKSVTGGKIAATHEALKRTTSDNVKPTAIKQKEMIKSIEVLNISKRIKTALKNNQILTLKDLLKLSREEILELHLVGESSLLDIETALSEKGFYLK